MSAFTPSRLGQINAAGSTDALFLKVFPGEILGAFNATNVMMDRHIVRNISSGKSAQFPVLGKSSASYMTPGGQLTGGTIRANERVINIDGLLVDDKFVANIDEAMNHYDVRGEYATQMGESLANAADTNVMTVGLLGARASATITGANGTDGGTSLVHSNSHVTASLLVAAVSDVAQNMDEKNISKSDRFIALRPAQYHLVIQATDALNRDWGGQGSFANAQLPLLSGMNVVESNNIPSTNIASSPSGANNVYHGDFSNTVAFGWHRSAIGTVALLGLAVEREYLIQNQGTLMVAKYAYGHGYLRPEGCAEILHAAI